MAYTRRQELMCTEDQMRAKPNVVLRENEAIYIKMNDGTLRQKMGDGITTIINLPFTQVFDGSVVQTTGDSKTVVMSQKAVTDEVNNRVRKNYVDYPRVKQEDITNTFEFDDGYIDHTTGDFNSLSGNPKITSGYISVDGVDGYIITADEKYDTSILPIFDEEQTFLGSYFYDKRVNGEVVLVNEVLSAQSIIEKYPTAKYVKIGCWNALPTIVNYESRETLFNSIFEVLEGNSTIELTELEIKNTDSNSVLENNTGNVTYVAGLDCVVNSYDVSELDKVYISASAKWINGLYAFYNVNGDFLSGVASEVNELYSIDDVEITVPQNAVILKVSKMGTSSGNAKTTKVVIDGKKKWNGKKWTCVGDSLTEANSRTTMNYHDYVAEATGISVVNMGLSGSGYKRLYDSDNAFYQRIVNVPTDSDVVTIFGSGNDLSFELGTPTDTGTDTLGGCINTTIDNLIGIMPAVQLGIVAPTPWVGNQPTLDDSNGMAQYTELLRKICKIRSIPFLDLYHCSNLRPWTEEGRNACYTKDEGNGVHPDETGHKIIASRFEGFLNTLLL